jgi:hypothetical protein
MARPSRREFSKVTRQALLRRFEEECLQPSRERILASPNSFYTETDLIVREAKDYFRSRYGDLPNHKEALYLFAKGRLLQLIKDEPMIERSLGEWEASRSSYRYARWILLPENSWESPSSYDPGRIDYHEGFVEAAQSLVRFAATWASSPPPPPRDPVELNLEAKILQAERLLEAHKTEFKAYLVAKEKAAREQAERDRLAKEKAEQTARERLAQERAERERAKRESRERAENAQRAREQTSYRDASIPQWALVLDLSPPYTEQQIRTAYRKMAKLTHPDAGGTDKEFREANSAYEDSMAYYRRSRASTS